MGRPSTTLAIYRPSGFTQASAASRNTAINAADSKVIRISRLSGARTRDRCREPRPAGRSASKSSSFHPSKARDGPDEPARDPIERDDQQKVEGVHGTALPVT